MKKVIHILNRAILMILLGIPCTIHGGDLLETINNHPELELFKEVITYGGGKQILTATSESFLLNKILPVIVFAPSDDAMKKAGYTKEIIRSSAQADGYVENLPDKYSYKFRDLICQHIMIKAQEKKESLKKSYERVSGMTIRIDNGIIKTNSNQAQIIIPNIEATNGIIHIINTVLDP